MVLQAISNLNRGLHIPIAITLPYEYRAAVSIVSIATTTLYAYTNNLAVSSRHSV